MDISPELEPPASIFMVPFIQGALLLLLFCSLVFRVNELTLFCLVLLVLGAGCSLWSRVSLKRVHCTLVVDRQRLFAGEHLSIGIRCVNAKLLPILLKADLRLSSAMAGTDRDQWLHGESGLLWFHSFVTERACCPGKRGVYTLNAPLLRGGDLFGFFLKESRAPQNPHEILVFPRKIRIGPLTVLRREFFDRPGSRSPVSDPLLMYGTRDYQQSSPARTIHWKASARHLRMQEKLCEPAAQAKALILLDVHRFHHATEAFEHCLEVIAALAQRWLRQGIATGLVTNGIPAGRGRQGLPVSCSPRQAGAVLEMLARVTPRKAGHLAHILSAGYRIPWGVSAVLFARDYDDQTIDTTGFLHHRHIPLQVILAAADSESSDSGRPREAPVARRLDDLITGEDKR